MINIYVSQSNYSHTGQINNGRKYHPIFGMSFNIVYVVINWYRPIIGVCYNGM